MQTIAVSLSANPERTVDIPLEVTHQGGATSADYSGVPSSVTFGSGETSKSFTFAADQDTEDDDEDSVLLSFGTMPDARVNPGTPDEATVSIADDDDPFVTVMFGQTDYVVVEGQTILVRAALSADPERTVVIPLTATNQDGASSNDYSGVPDNVTLSAGETSRTFEFTASEDSFADTGESVKLGFGTMPDARVSAGSPEEATVHIRQFSTEFTLDCMTSVWCADLQFSDQSQLDWGWALLEHGKRKDPASTLIDDSFTFRGVEYVVQAIRLRAGTYPTLANAWSREEQNESYLEIFIRRAEWSVGPSREHYQDWVLHMDGLQLPFQDTVDYQGGFLWIDADLQQFYNDWTSTKVTQIGIEERQDLPPSLAVPWLPRAVDAHGYYRNGRPELAVSWNSPHWHYPLPEPTGYIVQWKLASDSWDAPGAVDQMEVRGDHGRGVRIQGLRGNNLVGSALYSARVFAFNDVGDGPVSEDTLGRTQGGSPRLMATTVNGPNLTLRYDRDLDANSIPAAASFVVLVDAGLRAVTRVEVNGREVILTLFTPVHADNHVQAVYEEPNDPTATFLRDTDGQHVDLSSRSDRLQNVVNETPRTDLPPLTAEFANFPSSHDGSAPFTFNVEFSESVWISQGLPRDDMLEVVGGTVTSAHPDDRNTELWKVTVLPETHGDISITLPGGFCHHIYDNSTASQLVAGAPCAAGDRALSNMPSQMIPGPAPQQQVVGNTPATGLPVIYGIPELGQTLSADTSAVSDADGLDNAVFTYRWLADDVETGGATGSTHTLTDDDLGKAIRVRVDFTDDAGHEESLTSEPITVVATAVGPALRSATVDGATLTLTFDKTLDTGVIPPSGLFAVNVNGAPRSVLGVAVGETNVALLLSPEVVAGDAVTVAYTAPTDESAARLQDSSGNAAESFSGQAVTNDTTASGGGGGERSDEQEPPGVPENLGVDRHESGELLASWNAPGSGPAPTGYTVQWKESGDNWDDPGAVSETNVTRTSYVIGGLTDGTEYAARVVATRDGADSDPSAEVLATPRETVPPTLSSASVDGSILTLAFDEELDRTTRLSSGRFAVNVNGSPRPVVGVTVHQSNVLLHLSAPVAAGDTVTVDYTAPTDAREDGRVQDLIGNLADSFSGQAVTNETTASGGGGGGGGGERSDEQAPPGVPQGLDVALQQSGKLKATWNAPGSGPAPTGYTVQWKAAVDAWEDPGAVSETDVTKTSYVIGGLTDGVEYAARVVATRDGANSAPSEEVTAMPQETTPPELSSASVDGATLTLTFDEALDTDTTPHTSAFAVTVAGSSRGVEVVGVSGSAVTLTLVTAVFAGDAVTVDYTAPAGESASRLQDQVGNAAASFSGQSVTNRTPAAVQLTASAHDVPANHDGNSAFTFELRFSETPRKGFSYKTLRDHAFTVTNGDVTNARRLEKGKNVRWEIHVTPDGDGTVTVVLPVTTDCAATGAVCTSDGRMLSTRLELTVSGPGG